MDTFTLRGYETDAHGRLSVPALMNILQESANRNAAEHGFGMADLTQFSQSALGWMLMRFRLRMYHYPVYGQTIQVMTYPTFVEKYFIYRDFRVLAEDGTLLADATSTWLVFSMEKRTMVPLPDFIRNLTLPSHPDPLPRLPLKPDFQTAPFSPILEKTVEVGWLSIDQNQHVNNVAYVQWLVECVEDETLKTRELAEIDLVYRTESHWHDRLRVQLAIDTSAEAPSDTRLHRIEHSGSGKEILLARTRWRTSD
ncbi:acyl-[acyl-carrier-protein] thioesterase [Spirosoma taeanense]|nr:acyl-ACP thioesterase domain-containing protein [Spirosoma taeanense]